MVNCGGVCVEKGDPKTDLDDGMWTWEDGGATKDATLVAMTAAFQGQVRLAKTLPDPQLLLICFCAFTVTCLEWW